MTTTLLNPWQQAEPLIATVLREEFGIRDGVIDSQWGHLLANYPLQVRIRSGGIVHEFDLSRAEIAAGFPAMAPRIYRECQAFAFNIWSKTCAS